MTATPNSIKEDVLVAPLTRAGATFDPDLDSGAMSFYIDKKHFLLFVLDVEDLDPERVELTYVDLPTEAELLEMFGEPDVGGEG